MTELKGRMTTTTEPPSLAYFVSFSFNRSERQMRISTFHQLGAVLQPANPPPVDTQIKNKPHTLISHSTTVCSNSQPDNRKKLTFSHLQNGGGGVMPPSPGLLNNTKAFSQVCACCCCCCWQRKLHGEEEKMVGG